ncbi:MAG: ribonuclease H-like domain-containing protein [Halobacteriaceae archaeon]
MTGLSILAFSDWRTQSIDDLHTVVEHLDQDIDVLLYGGDDIGRFVNTTENHFHKLACTADARLGYVLGNDDHPRQLRHFQIESDRVNDLHQNPFEECGYHFIGQSGDVGEPAMGPVQYSEEEAASHLEQLHSDIDNDPIILVSHTPPYGTLDFAQRFNVQRIGSRAVKEFAENIQPAFVLSGHVHSHGGQTEFEEYGPVINIASHDSKDAKGRIAIIELPLANGEDQPQGIDVTHTTLSQLAYEIDGLTGELKSTSSLTKLSQIGPSRADQLRECGIQTIDELASLDFETLTNKCHIPSSYLERSYNHAKSYVKNDLVITDTSKYEEVQDNNAVLVDIETDLALSRVWCIGAYSYRHDEFEQFVNLDDEEALIHEFTQYVERFDHPRLVYYAGNSFDEKHLTEAADRHDIQLDETVCEWIDLCITARQTIFQPTEGHELETIAGGLGYEFKNPDISGMEVGSVYSAYLNEGDAPDGGWARYLEYNMDDTLAIKHIIDSIVGATQQSGIEKLDDREGYQPTDYLNSSTGTPTTGTNTSDSSDSQSVKTSVEDISQPGLRRDPYEVLDSESPIVHWSEKDPINEEVDNLPECWKCEEVIRPAEETNEITIDGETLIKHEKGCGTIRPRET